MAKRRRSGMRKRNVTSGRLSEAELSGHVDQPAADSQPLGVRSSKGPTRDIEELVESAEAGISGAERAVQLAEVNRLTQMGTAGPDRRGLGGLESPE